MFSIEKLSSIIEIRDKVKQCEGYHMQQVCFSSYHDALTQICFGCKKIRTNIKGV